MPVIGQADRVRALRSLFLSSMPVDAADRLIDAALVIELDAREMLFSEGDRAQAVHVVLAGVIKLARGSRSGDEVVVGVYTPGESLAEALAFTAEPFPVSAEALTRSRILAIPHEAVRAVVMGSEAAIGAILAATYRHLHALVGQIEHLKADTSQRRIGHFLLSHAGEGTGPARFRLPYEKGVIAGLLGVTPETLSRGFARLAEAGVDVDGQTVRLADRDRLRAFLQPR